MVSYSARLERKESKEELDALHVEKLSVSRIVNVSTRRHPEESEPVLLLPDSEY
jgi:hypothetical protein